MKVLYAGFKGDTNPSKILLDEMVCEYKIYLDNDFLKSEKQLFEMLGKNQFDQIILFGRKPASKTLSIELKAKSETLEYLTNYEYFDLYTKFIDNNFKVKLSDKPGNYLCNNIYYKALDYVMDKKIDTKVIFIHLPNTEYFDMKKMKELLLMN